MKLRERNLSIIENIVLPADFMTNKIKYYIERIYRKI